MCLNGTRELHHLSLIPYSVNTHTSLYTYYSKCAVPYRSYNPVSQTHTYKTEKTYAYRTSAAANTHNHDVYVLRAIFQCKWMEKQITKPLALCVLLLRACMLTFFYWYANQ